jgi:DNA-binding NtrC family response regulator
MTAVYLVEDDAALRDLLSEAFEDDGHQVIMLHDVDQIADQVARTGRGVAVVDGWGTSHRELCEADRDKLQRLAATVPTIVMTGRAWVERVRPEELGVLAVLNKPADLNCLLDLIASTTADG